MQQSWFALVTVVVLASALLSNAFIFHGIQVQRAGQVMIPSRTIPWFYGEGITEMPIVLRRKDDLVTYNSMPWNKVNYRVNLYSASWLRRWSPRFIEQSGQPKTASRKKIVYWANSFSEYENFKPKGQRFFIDIVTPHAKRAVARSDKFMVYPVGRNARINQRLAFIRKIRTNEFYTVGSVMHFVAKLDDFVQSEQSITVRMVNAATGERVPLAVAELKDVPMSSTVPFEMTTGAATAGRYFIEAHLRRRFRRPTFIYRSKPFFISNTSARRDRHSVVQNYFGKQLKYDTLKFVLNRCERRHVFDQIGQSLSTGFQYVNG